MELTIKTWIILLILILATFKLIAGDAELLIRFESYDNPEGKLKSGRCCDGWPIFCEYGCDYYFRVCLDEQFGPNNVKTCEYGYYRTEEAFKDKRSVVFGDVIGGQDNPFLFKIPGTINRMVDLKIDVKDKDHLSRSDYVDFLRADIWLYKGIFEEVKFPLDLISRTRLHTIITLRCAEDWYGDDCGTYCQHPGSGDHFDCDKITGRQICHQGWFGTSCNMHAVGAEPPQS